MDIARAQVPCDSNGDGTTNVQDVITAINEILVILPAPGNPDCNLDGFLDVSDIISITNVILGLVPNGQIPPEGVIVGVILGHKDLQVEDSTATSSGNLTSTALNKPIQDATLVIEEENIISNTNSNGAFTIPNLSPGDYQIRVAKTVDGNLIDFTLPVILNETSGTAVTAEIRWGEIITTYRYSDDTGIWEVTELPGGFRKVVLNGRIIEFTTFNSVTYLDDDQNGSFERCEIGPDNFPCIPADLVAITLQVYDQELILGESTYIQAIGTFSDGHEEEITYLVTWSSSDPNVGEVNNWGEFVSLSVGTTEVWATFNEIESPHIAINVIPRPPLKSITVENASCRIFLLGEPRPPALISPTDIWYPPLCTNVIEVGGTLQLIAYGEFEGGYFEDITDEVEWHVAPSSSGDVSNVGMFTAKAPGTASITAFLEGVTSNLLEIQIVEEPTLISLEIFTESFYGYPLPLPLEPQGGVEVGLNVPIPCLEECPGQTQSVLVGDTVQFHAIGRYDTGLWQDVTNEIIWTSSKSNVGSINPSGLFTALSVGTTDVEASFDNVKSNFISINVVSEATLIDIYIYREGTAGIIKKGENEFFHAVGTYDIGIQREITNEVEWKVSPPESGSINSSGVFLAAGSGVVEVRAVLGGITSNIISVEVWEESELNYCDPENINRSYWADEFNRVILETDCREYQIPDIVSIRYTIEELSPNPGGILDPCLDLYVYRGQELIRTIREEGCGEAFAPPNAAEALRPIYQLLAFWDLRDSRGNLIPPGIYTIYGRFYIYFDPVVRVDIEIK